MSEGGLEVRVLFFGKARELVDKEEAKILVPDTQISCNALKELLFNREFPALNDIYSSCILAVDQRYLSEDSEVKLTAFSEIAVIPPLSGG